MIDLKNRGVFEIFRKSFRFEAIDSENYNKVNIDPLQGILPSYWNRIWIGEKNNNFKKKQLTDELEL